jgi:phosphotransferase system HPr-like phosphotransfer protein
MYQIISSKVKIDNLSMRQIMDLYQEIKKFEGNIYFLCKHKVVDAAKLPKLVSFLLMVDEKAEVKVVIEGQNVQTMLDKMKNYFQAVSAKQQNSFKFYMNPTDTVQI